MLSSTARANHRWAAILTGGERTLNLALSRDFEKLIHAPRSRQNSQYPPPPTATKMYPTTYIRDARLDSADTHDDIPQDVEMIAHLIVDDNIIRQVGPVSEESKHSWRLKFDCEVPMHAATCLIAVLRNSKSQGTRLVGSLQIVRDDVFACMEQNQEFHQQLTKVNPDGPSLGFSAVFSTVMPSSAPLFGPSTPQLHIGPLDSQSIETDLQDIQSATASLKPIDSQKLSLLHERILLLSNPDRGQLLNLLGTINLTRHSAQLPAGNLDDAVRLFEDAVRDFPAEPIYRSNLGIALRDRFELLGDLRDINQSVLMCQEAVQCTPDDHSFKHYRGVNLGRSLLRRFKRLGDLGDLNEGVFMYEQAVRQIPDGHPEAIQWLRNLGDFLRLRFECLGDSGDMDQAILMFKRALQLTPDDHPHKHMQYNTLGNYLLGRFKRLRDLGDINESVLMYEQSVTLIPDGHTDKPIWFSNLGNSLRLRYEQLGDIGDIKRSVSMSQQAVHLIPDGHPAKAALLSNLGYSVLARFERLGDTGDINESVLMCEQSIALTPDGHPDKPLRFSDLGNSLRLRFERLGEIGDIERSVSTSQQAVQLIPAGHPEKPTLLNNLGTSVLGRFVVLGGLHNINEAISMFQEAAELTVDGHQLKPSQFNNLGYSLRLRFDQLGDLSDITESVLSLKRAVGLMQDGNSRKPSLLTNLGISLQRRFVRLEALDDLNESVLVLRQAMNLTTDNEPSKPLMSNNLGYSLLRRFEWLGNLDDIDEAVVIFRRVIELSPDGHQIRPGSLNNLGTALIGRFERLGDVSDVDEAISMFQQAVESIPDEHPNKPSWLNNLGVALWVRFRRLGNPADAQEMFHHYISAARSTTGPASMRFDTASRWAGAAHTTEHPSLLDAYSTALGILPELVWLGLSISDRHHRVLKAGKVVRAAASTAIGAHDYQKAVEWLEQGRSVIWSQLLDLRTPVDELRKGHPDLADRLLSISIQLEQAGTRDDLSTIKEETETLQSTAQRYHENAESRTRLLEEIRRLEGFERFLLPKSISELSVAAGGGPVVILNISEISCDALVLKPDLGDKVLCIPLPDLTVTYAESLAESLATLVHSGGRSERLKMRREGYVPPPVQFSNILAELWWRVVKPVLSTLGIKTPSQENQQRIWWCPTGPLSFLPIHAAGLYGNNEFFGSKLSDFVISSYTPSLTALIHGFRTGSGSKENFRFLAVAQPSATGQNYLPGTRAELNHIERLIPGDISFTRLEQNAATVGSVQQGMRDSRWAHFACHGVQQVSNPTESALLLAGSSQLTLSSIIKLSLPDADLAFLSACQTATGAKDLQEESVHLAAGMLLAGYRGVIATMWSIMDEDAPHVAEDVYEHLFKTSPPDPTRAAEALHLAVRKLREESGGTKSLFHWVPFIHVGTGSPMGASNAGKIGAGESDRNSREPCKELVTGQE
ncbi:CHAT domain-containing protein [Mycena capillaripes]|nr:CHAT domain-containing protein [Mycena capillaripes]